MVSDQYFITKEPRMEDDDDFHSNVAFINRSNGLVERPCRILDDFIKCNFTAIFLYLNLGNYSAAVINFL